MKLVGIDEMPKSQIEKRKRNMESISRISRREKRNVEICFLVREENENFCTKNREICNFLQCREEKEKFWNQISWGERRSRRRDFKLFVTRKRNPPFPFQFFSSVLKTQNQIFATRGVLTLKSRIKIVCLTIPSPKCNDH